MNDSFVLVSENSHLRLTDKGFHAIVIWSSLQQLIVYNRLLALTPLELWVLRLWNLYLNQIWVEIGSSRFFLLRLKFRIYTLVTPVLNVALVIQFIVTFCVVVTRSSGLSTTITHVGKGDRQINHIDFVFPSTFFAMLHQIYRLDKKNISFWNRWPGWGSCWIVGPETWPLPYSTYLKDWHHFSIYVLLYMSSYEKNRHSHKVNFENWTLAPSRIGPCLYRTARKAMYFASKGSTSVSAPAL